MRVWHAILIYVAIIVVAYMTDAKGWIVLATFAAFNIYDAIKENRK
jgi:hypothetical protein